MILRDIIQVKSNVFITARERGKRIPKLCRASHNVYVNLGRQFLAEVISPLAGFTGRVNDSMVQYMGMGIGGDEQTIGIATTYPTLNSHYPGQNIYSDLVTAVTWLERPVKVSGTAGTGASPGVWLNQVVAPPDLTGVTTVEFEALFADSEMHLAGAYPAVPLSEVGLFLSSETASRNSNEVYDYISAPDYINTSTRQQLIAYNAFAPLTKTPTVSLEIHWQLQF